MIDNLPFFFDSLLTHTNIHTYIHNPSFLPLLSLLQNTYAVLKSPIFFAILGSNRAGPGPGAPGGGGLSSGFRFPFFSFFFFFFS